MAVKLRLASSGGDIKVWDMPELSMVKAFSPHSQPVGSLCWSPNNQCLASAANDKVVVTFAKEDVFNPTEITVEEGNTCVAFNSSSRYLLIGGKSKTLSIWDMKTKSIKKTYKDHKDVVSCLVFNWNDTAIASGSVDGDILLHNVITGQASDPFRLPKTQAVRDIQFSHFKKSLLGAVSDDGALNLWDSNTRKLLTSFAADHKAPATGLSFSPMNDMLLCSVGLDKRIVFYDVQGKKSVKVMTAESPLTAVDFMADGATLAVGSTRGKIFLYDLRSGSTPVGMTAAHKTSVQSLAFQSSVKVSSAGNNRSLKPAASNLKPPSRQAPEPPKATTDPSPPSTPPGKQPESAAAQYSNIKQNGVKEDEEDIFSPLREVKTAAVNSSAVSLAGSQQDSSTNYKENNPPDISGIFSPLGSNPSVSVQPHPPVGPAATQHNNDQQRGISPQTVGETTANAPTTSQNTRSVSNVGSSGTRSLSDLRPAQGLGPGNNFKSYSDSHLITGQGQVNTRPFSGSNLGGSLVPSSARPHSGSALDTRPPLDGGTGKRSEDDFSLENSQGFRNGLDTEVYDSSKQSFIRTPPGSNRKGSRDGTEKVPLPSSPSRVRRPADGAGTVDQGLGLHGAVSTMGGSSQVSSERQVLDDAKLSPEPLFSGAVTMVTPDVNGASVGNAGLLPFQVQFIKNLIDESLDEFRVALHKDIVNVQVEMLRQFQIQQNELKAMLQKYSVNEALVTEIERLKEENNRLKTKY